jgi:murein DD-endopeptidase MepM/ murein hydrolase activator NlpD
MNQAFIPQNKQHKSFARSAKNLLLVALSLISVPTLVWQQQTVKALEVEKVATSNSWGSASFPVENFQAYTSTFGYRRSATGGQGWEFHRGLDLAAPQGSYIRSWWTGKVVEVSDKSGCGTHIVIQSGEWEHIYCHMKGHVETQGSNRYLIDREGGVQIWEGQQLSSGTRIGRVGMTGRTTGPHLHWGLKYANNYVDPALVLRAMYAQQSGNSVQSTLRLHEQKQFQIAKY